MGEAGTGEAWAGAEGSDRQLQQEKSSESAPLASETVHPGTAAAPRFEASGGAPDGDGAAPDAVQLPWVDVPAVEITSETAAELLGGRQRPQGDPGLRQLHPLPRGLVEFYGLLAVLFVLVPEWMAGGALFGFREAREGTALPPPSAAWKRLPELRLASLSLAELRLLARDCRLRGYGRYDRESLTDRLLQRLRRSR